MKDDVFNIPTCFCLKCGHTFTHASNLTGKGNPRPGDCTLCIECGQLLVFNDDMTVSLITVEEAQLSPEKRRKIILAQLVIARIRPHHPKETKQ